MKQRTKEFKKSIDQALGDQRLQNALHNFGDAYVVSRANAFAGYDFEAMRQEIGAMKTAVRENRQELLQQFISQAEAAGSKVYLAKDAADANNYICQLAHKHQATKVVKSKSMVSEETHLNKALKKAGISPLETDLGEWILQLADHRPSHMVMPAIHMFRDQIAALFAKASGEPLTDDINELVRIARRQLRQGYFEAGIGITGANALIAETGGIVLVTNEGNARLVSTIPPVHVVLSGIEKIVPTLEDAAKVVRILPKNATGQPLNSYVTWIRGAVPGADGTPKEQHIVLIDNGRNRLFEDKDCRDALNCIRCGACANVCPVYQSVGGHAFGSIYISAIGAILTAFYEGLDKAAELIKACIGCRSCSAVCPSNIDLEGIILHLRSKIAEKEGVGAIKDLAFRKLMRNRRLFHSIVRSASLLQKPFVGETGTIRHLPLFFSNQTDWRSLPAIAEKPLRDLIPKQQQISANRGKVTLFAGCGAEFVHPELGTSLVKVLNHLGVEVMFPEGQNCCGIPALYSGDKETMRDLAKQNLDCLLDGNPDYVVTICPTCTMALRKEFGEVLKGDQNYTALVEQLAAKVIDVSAYIYDVLGAADEFEGAGLSGSLTYHDSCHLKRGSGVSDQPRTLLKATGKELIEMAHPDRCCGFGGSYSFLSHPPVSRKLTGRKTDEIAATGAKTVAMDCPGCKIMLKGALEKCASGITAKHTIEILAEAIDRR